MTSEEIIKQRMNAYNLSLLMESERAYDDPISILNLLSIAGFKLVSLSEDDFDEEGVSIVSKAYMYAVVENIESSHYNSESFQQDQSDTSQQDSDDVNFDDYIDENIYETEDDFDEEDFE